MDDVAVLDDIIATFNAQRPAFTSGTEVTGGHKVIVGNDLSADETSLHVRVDLPGGLMGGSATAQGPGSNHLGTGGCEEGD
jgi:hypothetical protein